MPSIDFKLDKIKATAQLLLKQIPENVFCFYGDMGAGKTTLTKALLQELGAEDPGNSPTFGLVNEYHDTTGQLLAYHFDFYRINSEEEALDIGLEDYFNTEAYIFIEWPEKIANLLPTEKRNIELSFVDENTRKLSF